MDERVRDGWHLDKRVPLGLIFAIIIQTGTFIWFMSDLANEVENNATDIIEIRSVDTFQDSQIRSLGQADNKQAILLGQIEVELRNLTTILEKLEVRLSD